MLAAIFINMAKTKKICREIQEAFAYKKRKKRENKK